MGWAALSRFYGFTPAQIRTLTAGEHSAYTEYADTVAQAAQRRSGG